MMTGHETVIEIKGLENRFGPVIVHQDLDLSIQRGEILAIVGGSGSGKTTLIRSVLMLQRPTKGTIHVFDTDVLNCTEDEAIVIRRRWGVLFQQGALFSSLTVLENIMFPMANFTEMEPDVQEEVATLRLCLVGLSPDVGRLYPSELSGGMLKRVAAARAIALDPELLFLDEPTSGLDPQSAEAFDYLIKDLRDNLGLTIIMVTHDLDSLWEATDRVAFLGDKKVLAVEPMSELIKNDHPLIQAFFAGARGQARARLNEQQGSEHGS